MIQIALLDSRKLFRASIETFIDTFPNCKVEMSANSLVELCNFKEKIDLIIVDPNQINGGDQLFLDKLQFHFPNSRILILTGLLDRSSILSAIDKQVYAYFSKEDSPSELRKVICGIMIEDAQVTYFSEKVRSFLTELSENKAEDNTGLSSRELQILELICKEKTNTEISKILKLSVRTVESHRRRMIEKTECRSIVGVIINAVSSNLIPYDDFQNPFRKNELNHV